MSYMNKRIMIFSNPHLSPSEKAEKELLEWYNKLEEWCKYDPDKKMCDGNKFLASDDAITVTLFNLFNDFLYTNSTEIIQLQDNASILQNFSEKIVNLIKGSKVRKNEYLIPEKAAQDFVRIALKDDWNFYTALNPYIKKFTISHGRNKYISLDAFVAGFRNYRDEMEAVTTNTELPDMPLQQHSQPKANVPIRPPKLPSNVSNQQSNRYLLLPSNAKAKVRTSYFNELKKKAERFLNMVRKTDNNARFIPQQTYLVNPLYDDHKHDASENKSTDDDNQVDYKSYFENVTNWRNIIANPVFDRDGILVDSKLGGRKVSPRSKRNTQRKTDTKASTRDTEKKSSKPKTSKQSTSSKQNTTKKPSTIQSKKTARKTKQ